MNQNSIKFFVKTPSNFKLKLDDTLISKDDFTILFNEQKTKALIKNKKYTIKKIEFYTYKNRFTHTIDEEYYVEITIDSEYRKNHMFSNLSYFYTPQEIRQQKLKKIQNV